MIVDVAHQISAVRREVGGRVLEAGTARVMTVSRTYDATVEEVWDACTDAERMARWFTPVSGDLRLGGRYQLEGNASGTIERCEPPHLVGATWEYGGDVSWIELRLGAETDATTRLTLEHVAHVDDERWAQFGPGAVGLGWDMGFFGLGQHIGSGEGVTPEGAAAWMASEDGIAFMRGSNERWRDASVAAGTPEDEAQGAADRTLAAYTGTSSA
jgi:uncharacterized protein YndB with AHSA1/START domain